MACTPPTVKLTLNNLHRIADVCVRLTCVKSTKCVQVICENSLPETVAIDGCACVLIKGVPKRRAPHGALKHAVGKNALG